MTTVRTRLLALALAIASAATLAACGGGESQAAADEITALPAEVVPSELEGLTVASEEIANLKEVKRPFVEAAGLYSLRSGEQLQATLQISRFTPEAETDKDTFRQAVVQQIGSTVPKIFRMGEQTIYLTTGRRQSIAVWFRDRYVFVLATREEYDRPRTLLRSALEIKP